MPIQTYLDRASGRIHDSVITKFTDANFNALPERNHLSSNASVTDAQKQQCAGTVGASGEYYSIDEHDNTWNNASRPELRETIIDGRTEWRNVWRFNLFCVLPVLPEHLPEKVSLCLL